MIMHAVARAADEDRIMHAYRRSNRLILFDDVDVNTQIEVVTEGQRIVKPRGPGCQSQEHQAVDQEFAPVSGPGKGAERHDRALLTFLRFPRSTTIPCPARCDVQSHLVQTPRRHCWAESGGMTGPGGGRGIPIAPSTLIITLGGIATKPRYIDGSLELARAVGPDDFS